MQDKYSVYVQALREELVPAMGCTEPIAIAYASAVCREQLGGFPEKIDIYVSRNIVKNVKSVVVPNTNKMRGIEVASIAGFVAGNSERKLQVLAYITDEEKNMIKQYTAANIVKVMLTEEPDIFYIQVVGFFNGHTASVTIRTEHTNITCIKVDNKVVFEKPVTDTLLSDEVQELWKIEEVIEAASNMPLEPIREYLERQIAYNMAIAEEGLKNEYGSSIGKILLQREPGSKRIQAKANAAAASDARMNGCELPVVIVSGSGNQGITASVPVVVYGRNMNADPEKILRAVLLSDLITIYIKQGIGKLSAYCGAVSAGSGSGAGIAYLYGCDAKQIEHVVENALAINSGIICDGAKSSCAAKIAISIEGGLLGFDMMMAEKNFASGDGIVQKTADETIAAVGKIASQGMVETDREIIDVMLGI